MARMRKESSDDIARYTAAEIRPTLRTMLVPVVSALATGWLLAGLLYLFATEAGRAITAERGIASALFGWCGMAALIMIGALTGYAITRSTVWLRRRFGERDVPVLALVDALGASVGAIAIAFVITIASAQVLTLLAWTFVITVLFTTAGLVPSYLQAWRVRHQSS